MPETADQNMELKKALVVEGGAMRGVFATGVLDRFLSENYNPFDFCIGVSAGATNLAAWLCRQKERNLKVYMDYSCRPQFISFRKFLKGGHALDLDWLWDITIKEIRLDLEQFRKQKTTLYVVTTNALCGKAEYIKAEPEGLEQLLKASSALPVFYRGYPEYNGVPMSDGGVADSIPVIEAYKMGARDITVILSRPRGYRKKEKNNSPLMNYMLRSYPALRSCMSNRASLYNKSIDFIENPPADCKIRVIAPSEGFDVGRTTKDKTRLMAGYEMGLEMGKLSEYGYVST